MPDRRLLDALVAAAQMTVVAYDRDGLLTYARPHASIGSEDDLLPLLGRPVVELWPDPSVTTAVQSALEGTTSRLSVVMEGRSWDVEHRPYRDGDGAVVGGIAVAVDVSDRVAAEDELRRSEVRWRLMALLGTDLAVLADAEGRVLWTSPAVEGLFGYTAEEVLGRIGFDYMHPDDVGRMQAFWSEVIASPGRPLTQEFRFRDASGGWRWAEEHVVNRLDDPDLAAIVVNLKDVSERKETERELARAALYDPLTGLPRLPLLRDRLARAAAGDGTPGSADAAHAVITADLRAFAEYNAQHGHDQGDLALVRVAEALTATTGPRDTVARTGADRFTLLRERVGDLQDGIRLAEQVRAAVRGLGLGLDVAVGAAVGSPVVPDDLLVAAGDALAAARAPGLVVPLAAQDIARPTLRPGRVTAELRSGIGRGELRVHVQPVVGVDGGEVRGVEALVRWQHPERGLLLPEEFLPAAEESGLVRELGEQVLLTACAWAAPRDLDYVAVNVSGRQLVGGGLPELVTRVLATTGLPARRLLLEVTETALIDDLDAGTRLLQDLHALGVHLALDDFGTGWSSLLYLKRLPVDRIKIDREFVSGVAAGDDDAAIVASVVSLARATGLRCTAEGVEDRAQLEALRELGCDDAQGFLWSEAVPLEEADAVLARLAAAARSAAPAPAADAPLVGRRRRSGPPEAAEDVVEILRLHSGGASLHTIAAALNTADRRTAKGARWHPNSVARVVAASAYPSLGD